MRLQRDLVELSGDLRERRRERVKAAGEIPARRRQGAVGLVAEEQRLDFTKLHKSTRVDRLLG